MRCLSCKNDISGNVWICPKCNNKIEGGIVFVSGISGSSSSKFIEKIIEDANSKGYKAKKFDIGEMLLELGHEQHPDLNFDQILDFDNSFRKTLRAIVFLQIAQEIEKKPDTVYFIDTHFCFRRDSHLICGCEPSLIIKLLNNTRCFINLIDNLATIKDNLNHSIFSENEIKELLIWRYEEQFLSEIFAGMGKGINSFVVSVNEPPSTIRKIVWNPETPRLYFSFPIRGVKDDNKAKRMIEEFKNRLQEKYIIFDPFTIKDFAQTQERGDLESIHKEISKDTELRDFRFIDQSQGIVAYFPTSVESDGVKMEMNHALKTGKTIFLSQPKQPRNDPFRINPEYYSNNPDQLLEIIDKKFNG